MIFTPEIRIYNQSGEIIPAGAIARLDLGQWDYANKHFPVLKPNADNMDWSELLSVPYSVPVDKIGVGFVGNIFAALSKPEEEVIYGDKVGTESGQWWLKKVEDDGYGNNEGQFLVIQGTEVPPDWQGDTSHYAGDIVKYSDTLYACIFAHTSSESSCPGTGNDWQNYWIITESLPFIVRPRIGNKFFGHFEEPEL